MLSLVGLLIEATFPMMTTLCCSATVKTFLSLRLKKLILKKSKTKRNIYRKLALGTQYSILYYQVSTS